MPDGSIFKRCGCRHPDTGRPLGNECPKLRRPNKAWSFEHGHWAYQLELPATSDGRRRQLRRSGLSTRRDATAELDHARALLALAVGDRGRRTEIAGGWLGRISNSISITLLSAYNVHRSSRANAMAAILASPTCRSAAKIDEWEATHGSRTSRPHALPP